jgi:hypothetical protein
MIKNRNFNRFNGNGRRAVMPAMVEEVFIFEVCEREGCASA